MRFRNQGGIGMDLTLKVTRIVQLTPRIKAFDLRPRDGGALPPFTAGAHIDVELGGGGSTRGRRTEQRWER